MEFKKAINIQNKRQNENSLAQLADHNFAVSERTGDHN